MLRKLLKYDMKAILKLWWIAAVASAAFAVLGGFCIKIIDTKYTSYIFMEGVATLGLMLAFMGFGAFVLATTVLIFVRFYKNFFSDEGYLTFTLPVKRSSLLNSKLISATIISLMTTLCLMFDIYLMLGVAYPDDVFTIKLFKNVFELFLDVFDVLGIYTFIYMIEAVIGYVLLVVCGILSIYVCITSASCIARRVKFLVALGFYYAYNSVLTFIAQLLLFDGSIIRIASLIDELGEGASMFGYAVLFLALIAALAVITAAFYTFEGYLLRRRLNLE